MEIVNIRGLKRSTHPNGEPYVCRMCGTELFYKMRTYKYYGNKSRSLAEWCPICLKFRNDSTNTLQRFYYEGMPGRVEYV